MANQKKIKIVCLTVLLIAGLFTVYNVFFQRTDIQTDEAIVVYNYVEKSINETLSQDEAVIIKKIFSNRRLFPDNPSCGFSTDVSVRYGDLIFCIACDQCPKIKLESKNKYFRVSEQDRAVIEEILGKYGATFPCL